MIKQEKIIATVIINDKPINIRFRKLDGTKLDGNGNAVKFNAIEVCKIGYFCDYDNEMYAYDTTPKFDESDDMSEWVNDYLINQYGKGAIIEVK